MKNVSALVGIIAVTLLMSSAQAQTPEDYVLTDPGGVLPDLGVVLKSERRDCPEGTRFFKNAFPSLSNGQGGGTRSEIFSIDNDDVIMTVTWTADNSFAFNIVDGVAHKVGVNVDSTNLLYDYTSSPVSGDEQLNQLANGQAAADVNHLDLCLTAVETVPPVVAITSPQEGATVAGTIIVTATITDNVEVSSAEASVNSVSLGAPVVSGSSYQWSWDTTTSSTNSPTILVTATDSSGNTNSDSVNVFLDTEPPEVTITSPTNGETVAGIVTVTAIVTDNVGLSSVTATAGGVSLGAPFSTSPYQWSWDTTTLSAGSQTVTVIATDTSDNMNSDSVEVTIPFSATSCIGLIGDDDPNQEEGCNPSGVENIQISPDNNFQPVDTIEAFLLTPDNPGTCGANGFLDPRVDASGFPIDPRPLYVFAELGGAPDPVSYPKTAGAQLILDEFTYGNPCFAVVYSERSFLLADAFPEWPNVDDPQTDDVEAGLVFIKTQFPEDVVDIGPIVECYDEVNNPDLQETGEATYQTTEVLRMVEMTAAAMTNACFNPKRLSSRDKSFSVLNTKEHCGIDFGSSTGPADVLNCKFGLADAKFDALDVALDTAAPFLISPKFSNLNKKFNQARSQYNKKNSRSLGRALGDLEDLLFQVATGDWTTTEENYPGDVQMRIENLIHRVTLLKRAVDNPFYPVQ